MYSILLRPLVWLAASLSVVATVLAVGFGHQTASAAPHAVVPPAEVANDDKPAVAKSPVKWHKSFEAAKAASLKSGKPVLLFHLGQPGKNACDTPVGVMLFTSFEVTDYINTNFEPVFEAGRLPSLAFLDFSDSARWSSPGGTATYICGPDGVVYDVMAGTYPPGVYRKQLEAIKTFTDSLRPFVLSRATPTEIERQRAVLSRDTRIREYRQRRQMEFFWTAMWRAPQFPVFGSIGGISGMGIYPACPGFCGGFTCCGGRTPGLLFCSSLNPGICGGFNCCGGVPNSNGFSGYSAQLGFGNFQIGSFQALGCFGGCPSGMPLSNGFGSYFGGLPGNCCGFQYQFQGFGSAIGR